MIWVFRGASRAQRWLEAGSRVTGRPSGIARQTAGGPRCDSWLKPAGPERRCFRATAAGAETYVIAIMMFVTIIVAAAGLALATAAGIAKGSRKSL